MSTFTDVNDFLESGGIPAAKFEEPGTEVSGTVVHAEQQQQREIDTGKPKFWDDGAPRMQIVVHLQTAQRDSEVPDDNGRRAVYVRGNMLKALRTALRTAGAQLEEGGTLTVRYTGDGQRTKAGFNPPKLYSAAYVPPAAGGMAAVNEALGAPAAPQAAAVTQAAPVRPPSVPAAVWDTLNADQQAALLAVTPAY